MNWLNLVKRAASVLGGESIKKEDADSIPIGADAANERYFYIHGIPHLFRDEGDRVVHFVGVFHLQIQSTPYGDKLLPEVIPRWQPVAVHGGESLQQVAANAIQTARETVRQTGSADAKASEQNEGGRRCTGKDTSAPERRDESGPATGFDATAAGSNKSAYSVGKVMEWGEMEFPSRKPGGPPSYRSFAVKLHTAEGEKTLQGEGLKTPSPRLAATLATESRSSVCVRKRCRPRQEDWRSDQGPENRRTEPLGPVGLAYQSRSLKGKHHGIRQ